VIALAEKRLEARVEKRWEESDELRDEIASLGWRIQDSQEGYKLVKDS
jgi:cysteinyl-tRNA synthetase